MMFDLLKVSDAKNQKMKMSEQNCDECDVFSWILLSMSTQNKTRICINLGVLSVLLLFKLLYETSWYQMD
jgi:hypothetical protein